MAKRIRTPQMIKANAKPAVKPPQANPVPTPQEQEAKQFAQQKAAATPNTQNITFNPDGTVQVTQYGETSQPMSPQEYKGYLTSKGGGGGGVITPNVAKVLQTQRNPLSNPDVVNRYAPPATNIPQNIEEIAPSQATLQQKHMQESTSIIGEISSQLQGQEVGGGMKMLAADIYDTLHSAITRKEPLKYQNAKESTANARKILSDDVALVRAGLKDPAELRIELQSARDSLIMLESATKGLSSQNLNYFIDNGAAVQSHLIYEKNELNNLLIQLNAAEQEARMAALQKTLGYGQA